MIDALSAFHFLRPQWLWALLLLLPLLAWGMRRRHHAGAWSRVCDPELLQAQLQRGESHASRALPLLLLGAALGVVAMAGPSWQQLPQPLHQTQAARVISLDLSRSMDATDIKPSRLDRARFALRDLLAAEPDIRTGLLVFAEAAHRVVPLTDDHDTLRHLLAALSTDILPPGAARFAPAIAEATGLLQAGGASQGQILIITDSAPESGSRQAIELARSAGYQVQFIGIGTRGGAPVPDQDGGWLKDDNGAIVMAGLDEAALRSLAARSGARYLRLDDWKPATAEAGRWNSVRDEGSTEARADLWQDEGRWLILLLLPLAALAGRRGWLGMLVLAVLPLLQPQSASASPWLNQDQQAYQKLQARQPVSAADQFQDPRWKAAALYESGRYEEAAQQYQALDTRSAQDHYNLGNALARAGQLEAALDAYDAALSSAPEMLDAQHNRALVEQLLQQQEQEQQSSSSDKDGENAEQSDSQESSADPSENGESSANQSSSEQSSSDSQQAPEPSEGDQNKPQHSDTDAEQQETQTAQQDEAGASEASAEEQQAQADAQLMGEEEAELSDSEREQAQAMEQWLRRVPDDPGGLLRRRFRWEQQRREQQERGTSSSTTRQQTW